VNPIDDKAIRQRLHAELGSLEISPVPVIAVTRRGKAIRGRRRAVAGGFAAVAVVAVLAVRAAQGPPPASVTLNAPPPGAPGGMFASGTAHGKPWRLAVRNVAADPGTAWCLPAVMLNGRDGGILGIVQPRTFPIVDGGVLTDPQGLRGSGFGFEVWAPDVTRVTYRLPGGLRLAQRPVALAACGRRYLMSGYSFTRPGTLWLTVYTRHGHTNVHFPLPDPARPWPPGAQPGIWSAAPAPAGGTASNGDIGSGRVDGWTWRMSATLGLDGQCYSAELSQGGRAPSFECVPVDAPPRTIALSQVPVPGATTDFTGYAGLVSPRAREVVASFDNGTTATVHPVNLAGRAYVAFVDPLGCQLTQLSLQFGHYSITITTLGLAQVIGHTTQP
jgi:hypothetical protein